MLLSNVIEGQWDGLPICLFDGSRGSTPRWTMILVTVEDMLRRGANADHAIAAGPAALIDTSLDVLFVTPKRAATVSASSISKRGNSRSASTNASCLREGGVVGSTR